MENRTVYADDPHPPNGGFYKVTYLVNETRTKLTRSFDSPYEASCFVRKLRRSGKCTLISAPLFQ